MYRSRILQLAAIAVAMFCASAIAQDGMAWRKVDPANLVFIGMDEGEVVLELNPVFAPATSEHFRQLVRSDFYRGLSFYRVIDGFVAQAGDESDVSGQVPAQALAPEFERPFDAETMTWTPVQAPDLYAPATGFIDGFAAGRDDDDTWLLHCPGAVAMARGNEADSGSTDFYVVIGQSPRYLDRNMSIFARVIDGMEVVQKVRRGELEDNGIIENELARSRIGRMRMAADLAPEERRDYYVMDTRTEAFSDYLEGRRDRRHAFFHHKPPRVLDVCQVPVASRSEPVSTLSRKVEP